MSPFDRFLDHHTPLIRSHRARRIVAGCCSGAIFLAIAVVGYWLTGSSVSMVFFIVFWMGYSIGEDAYDDK